MIEGDETRALLDQLFDGVVMVNVDGLITYWNKAAERLTGYEAKRVMGRHFQDQPARQLSPAGMELPEALIPLVLTLRDGLPREAMAYCNHADGYRLTLVTRTLPISGNSERPTAGIAIFTDNKALIAAFQAAQKTEETVLFDPLTGIGNRPHIETKIRTAIEDFRAGKLQFGILFIDIDHFKLFNDTHGHLLGDKALRLVANTIRNSLRVTDSCGRWGGEEFIAVVYGLELKGLSKVAEKLRASIADRKMRVGDRELGVTVSIGSTLMRAADTLQALIDRSDRLMYKSKQAGRDRVSVA